MKTKKLLKKIKELLSADRRAQVAKYDSLTEVLHKLEKKEVSLRAKLEEEEDEERCKEIQRKLEVIAAQHKKGTKLRAEIEAIVDVERVDRRDVQDDRVITLGTEPFDDGRHLLVDRTHQLLVAGHRKTGLWIEDFRAPRFIGNPTAIVFDLHLVELLLGTAALAASGFPLCEAW